MTKFVFRKRCLLKKAYNILLIVLAMTDMVTGAVIVVTPGFIVPVDKFPYPTGMTGLSLFCHLIDTKFLIFTMGKASVLMVMCLAIERWLASVKPLQYRIQFSSRRLACYITTICTVCLGEFQAKMDVVGQRKRLGQSPWKQWQYHTCSSHLLFQAL